MSYLNYLWSVLSTIFKVWWSTHSLPICWESHTVYSISSDSSWTVPFDQQELRFRIDFTLHDNNVMHAKPGLRVLLKWMIYRSGSVITDDYEVPGSASVLFACVFAGFADLFIFDWFCVCAVWTQTCSTGLAWVIQRFAKTTIGTKRLFEVSSLSCWTWGLRSPCRFRIEWLNQKQSL